jgi:hypothetical protein
MTPPSQAKLAAFVEQNPFVAGFLKCCFDCGLSPQQVAPLVKKASLLPEAREEFEKVAFWINGALTVASLLPWLWQWWAGNKQQQPEGQTQPGTKPGTQPKPPAPKSPNGIGVTEQPGATVAQSVSPNQPPIQPMAEPLEQPKLAYDKKSMAGLASLFRIPGLAGLLAKMFRSTPSTLAKGSPGAMEFGRAGILPGLRAKGPVQRMRSSMLPTNPPPVPAKTNLLPNLEKNAMWPWLARAGGWLANLFRWGKAGPKPGPTDPWAGFRSATPKAPPDRTWGKYMADVMAPSVIPAAGFIGLGIVSDRAQQARMQAAQEAENQNIIQSAELADVASQNNPKAVEAFARKYGLGDVQQQALSNLYGNPFIQNALTGQGQAGAVLSGLKQFGSLPGMDGMKLTRNLANQLSPGAGHVLEFPTAGDSRGPNRP